MANWGGGDPGWKYRRSCEGRNRAKVALLTVLCVVPAAAIAANVLDLFPDVAVDRKGHVVVVVVEVVRLLAVPFLAAEGHYFDQAERLFLGLLHRHGHVFSAPRVKPGAVHNGGRGVHSRVIGCPEHRDAKTGAEPQQCGF